MAVFPAGHFGGSRALALTSFAISTAGMYAIPVVGIYALMGFPVGEAPAGIWARFGPWLAACQRAM
jgi:hypothetical protein